MLKMIASGIILGALVTPALAAGYWVVQDASTQKCSIVEKKPNDTVNVMGNMFQTRAEAEELDGQNAEVWRFRLDHNGDGANCDIGMYLAADIPISGYRSAALEVSAG